MKKLSVLAIAVVLFTSGVLFTTTEQYQSDSMQDYYAGEEDYDPVVA